MPAFRLAFPREFSGAEKLRIVVVGATSEIAQACCRIWAKRDSHDFIFSGRDRGKLDSVINDLQVRFPTSRFVSEVFNHKDSRSIELFLGLCSLKPVDVVLIAHGSLTSQAKVTTDLGYLWTELETNALSPILFTEAFAGLLGKQGYGKLAVIGSVAGDRGRAINYAYGSGKAAIEAYVSGLQHRFGHSKVQVTLIKPGPTRTPMTAGNHVGPTKLADPGLVGSLIVRGIKEGRRVVYAPRSWRYTMRLIKVLPFWIFKTLKF
jgi:short-subunit dehydrogenase